MEEHLILDYQNGMGIYDVCKKYHIGKLKLKKILNYNNISLRKRGGQSLNKEYVIDDWKFEKYPHEKGFVYVAKSKDGKYETKDYMNQGGFLTTYINKEYNVSIPSLYERREYYKLTGNYWWEQWFYIIKIAKEQTKKCPYCGWETNDIENKSGAFEQHLLKEHNKNLDDYIKEFPNDLGYFKKYKSKIERIETLKREGGSIVCPICGKSYRKITDAHLKSYHNMNMYEFRNQFPDYVLACEELQKIDKENFKLSNLTISKNRFVSKGEREINNFLSSLGVETDCNRQIFCGKEIDIIIYKNKLCIEFDGLYWHREGQGKDRNYHLNKTIMCKKYGYSLIHVFEDEWVNNKEIVLSKIKHALGLDSSLPKVGGRQIQVKQIYYHEAKEFLDKYHIQGCTSASIYIGGYYKNELIAVMGFKFGNIKHKNWELVRFASNSKYQYQGVASKIFKWFIRNFNPSVVVSFADRRWTLDENNNLYTKLGFNLDSINRPDYKYFYVRGHEIKRIHKMRLTKKIMLSRNPHLNPTMTEHEMAKELGYDRIWDCGLLKYVWKNVNSTTV